MCLNIRKELTKEISRTKEGWKVFDTNAIGSVLLFGFTMQTCPVNRWVKANTSERIRFVPSLYSSVDAYYQSGFHVFLKRKDAEEWRKGEGTWAVIRKVKVRGIKTFGTQDGTVLKDGLAIVCDEILVKKSVG